MSSELISGEGTPEAAWGGWPGLSSLACVAPDAFVPAHSRAVVIAPHPDDEVLGAGGLLVQLAGARRRVLLIAVTDGAASHPGSTCWTPTRLTTARHYETTKALRRLGLNPMLRVRARFPDGAVSQHEAELAHFIDAYLRPGDVVFTTWRHDGHPDHEAVGRASAAAARAKGVRLVEYPIWAWHWARPGDTRVPWQRGRRVLLDRATLQRKRAAVGAFSSQLEPDSSTGRQAILARFVLKRLLRPYEVFLL